VATLPRKRTEKDELKRIRELLEDPRKRRRRRGLLHAWLTVRGLGRTVDVGRRTSWRYRAPLAPWVVAGLVVAGLFAAGRTDHPTVVGFVVAVLVLVLAVALHDRLPGQHERLVAAVTLVATAAWTAAAAVVGVDGRPMRVLAVALFVAGAAPWWRGHQVHGHPGRRAVAGATGLLLLWPRVTKKVMPDTHLLDIRPLIVAGRIVGEEATIEAGDESDLTTTKIIAKTEDITGRLKKPVGDVIIEGTEDGRADRARIMYLHANPLRKTHYWPGADLDLATGMSSIGPHADGSLAEYVWVQPGSGPWHDLIAGTTGAGKSSLIEMLLATSRASAGAIVDWIGDPQGGQSCPDWIDNVDRAATSPAHCVVLLERARDLMYARNALLAEMPWTDDQGRRRKGFSHFPWMLVGMPLLVVTLFEAHAALADPRGRSAAEDIGKMSRKCGIKLRLETQVPLLDQLGGSQTLRDMVAGGNVTVFRTANPLSGQVAFNGTLPVQPNRIPRAWPGSEPIEQRQTGGLGYSIGAASRAGWFRAWRLQDSLGAATTGRTWHLDEKSQESAGVWPPVRGDLAVPDVFALAAAKGPVATATVPDEGEPEQGRKAADIILDALSEGPQFTNDLVTQVMAVGYSRSTAYGTLKTLRGETGKPALIADIGGRYQLLEGANR
jgi:hypothetical protein